ncbi:MAG: alpha/beta hydrolase [Anaerolineae bacterium]|jgi:pimeloyl-ACP methyl ester carboxylesterase|nr:alpha/beta hydrolase [Anaerolineae bacterium]MBT7070954.1 alpha/beta hydrolase [Anaerolineae bacterium]MBT7989769.1 alpha/beta hydrolase [Anaerolineae bacterium]
MKNISRKQIIWGIILLVFAAALVWLVDWTTYARPPLPEAEAALISDENVEVTHKPWLTFTLSGVDVESGFIFYPGGRINPKSYAPLLKPIAAEGYLVVVPEMPINMAIFDVDAADEIMAQYPEIKHWVIGGHSVGGVSAAMYTAESPEQIDGLAIWAAYPADNSDISALDIPVLSIYGGREEGVTDESVGERKHLLPADTEYIKIEGGDHHQFGSYKIKPEEHLATVERSVQQAQIIEAMLDLLIRASQ